MSKAHGQRPWGSVLRSWPISTVTESAHGVCGEVSLHSH
jgi:hypothetical protein